MISSDHRSPNLSSEMLTGQPERRLELVQDTFDTLSKIACKLQVISGLVRKIRHARNLSRITGRPGLPPAQIPKTSSAGCSSAPQGASCKASVRRRQSWGGKTAADFPTRGQELKDS